MKQGAIGKILAVAAFLAVPGIAVAAPSSSTVLRCVYSGSGASWNDLYFEMVPGSDANISFYTSCSGRENVYVKAGEPLHFWMPCRTSMTGTGFVVLQSDVAAMDFGVSSVQCT